MITDYKLIQAEGNRELAKEVRRFLEMGEGWEPMGNPLCDSFEEGFTLYQAIVKRKPESVELSQLRWLEAETREAITAVELGQVSAEDALQHISATLVQVKP